MYWPGGKAGSIGEGVAVGPGQQAGSESIKQSRTVLSSIDHTCTVINVRFNPCRLITIVLVYCAVCTQRVELNKVLLCFIDSDPRVANRDSFTGGVGSGGITG